GALGLLEQQPQPVLAGLLHAVVLLEEEQPLFAVGRLHALGVLPRRSAPDRALLDLFPAAVEVEGGAVIVAELLAAAGVVEQAPDGAVVRVEAQGPREVVRRGVVAAGVEEVGAFGDDAAVFRALDLPHLEQQPLLLALPEKLFFAAAEFVLLQSILHLILA